MGVLIVMIDKSIEKLGTIIVIDKSRGTFEYGVKVKFHVIIVCHLLTLLSSCIWSRTLSLDSC